VHPDQLNIHQYQDLSMAARTLCHSADRYKSIFNKISRTFE